MWLFRREFKELRPEEKSLLNRLFVYSPESENTYTLRQQLTQIFESNQMKESASIAILAWCGRVRRRVWENPD